MSPRHRGGGSQLRSFSFCYSKLKLMTSAFVKLMASSATSLKIDQKSEQNKCVVFKTTVFAALLFPPAEATGRFHPSVRRGGSTSLPEVSSSSSSILPDWATHGRTGCKWTVLHWCVSSIQGEKNAAHSSPGHHTKTIYFCVHWRYAEAKKTEFVKNIRVIYSAEHSISEKTQ